MRRAILLLPGPLAGHLFAPKAPGGWVGLIATACGGDAFGAGPKEGDGIRNPERIGVGGACKSDAEQH